MSESNNLLTKREGIREKLTICEFIADRIASIFRPYEIGYS